MVGKTPHIGNLHALDAWEVTLNVGRGVGSKPRYMRDH